jgi:hypothetical protein
VTRWPLSRALLDLPASFGLTPGTFEGHPASAHLGVGLTNSPALVTFSSPSKTWSIRAARGRDRLWIDVLRHRPQWSLTWAPLMGLSKIRPSIGIGAWCPLQVSPAAPRSCRQARLRRDTPSDAGLPSARSCQPPGSFRPCRSSRLRRFAPPRTFQVCCTLKPIMGFATFQAVRSVSLTKPARPVAEASVLADLFPVPLAGARFARCPSGAVRVRRPTRRPSGAARIAVGFPGPFPMALYPSELSPCL